MNKKELVEAFAVRLDLDKKAAETYVDGLFDLITERILSGDKVLISGFGTFKMHQREERKGISPQNLKEIVIPASKTLVFKPSTRLKDELNK